MADKHTDSDKILLVLNDAIISNEKLIAQSFNTYFNDITRELNLKPWSPIRPSSTSTDPVQSAISKYKDHPSILKIRSLFPAETPFSFSEVDVETVEKLVMSLDSKKTTSGNINARMLKLSSNVCSSTLKSCINDALKSGVFPPSLKCATITPILKKGDPTCVKNYRPISILPTVSKIFEKVVASQLNAFFETRFSHLLCGFRKGHSTQHALLRLLHLWQRNLDQSNIIGTVLMDLSKAYDCLPHDLLIAKLAAYGLDNNSLTFIFDYLTSRKQRVKIGGVFSTWLEILLGVPQGSILGPLFFNIFINDLLSFIQETEICNFADDNSLYAFGKTITVVRSALEREIQNVLWWFETNSMVANPAKFQIMFLGTKEIIPEFNIGSISVPISDHVKLLGITIDNKLRFKRHIEELCRKASSKTKALLRIRPFLSSQVAKSLCNAYILSPFKYCPLIWMNFSIGSNSQLNRLHKRSLRAVFLNFDLNFDELLALDNGVSLHIYSIQKLLLEVFKSLNGLSPTFISELFQTKSSNYSLRSGHQLTLPPTKTRTFGTHSISFMGSLLWNRLPKEIKDSKSINQFKHRIKELSNRCCSCSICCQ